MATEQPLVAAAGILASMTSKEEQQGPKTKLGWKGAVDALARNGSLGASAHWSSVIKDIKKTTAELDEYDVALRKHTYAATIGNAKREVAKPAPCPVHAYNTSLSTLRQTMATFGKAPLEKPPPTAGPAVHSYSAMGSSFTPKLGATFGRAPTGRGEPPRTACSVHSYSGVPPSTPLVRKTPTRAGTFGTAPARPATIAMTRTGLLLSTGKPAVLPPLTPLQSKARSTTHALGFASKLKRAVSSAEDVTATAEVLIIDPSPDSIEDAAAATASAAELSEEHPRKVGKLGATATAATPEATPAETPEAIYTPAGDATPAELDVGEEEQGARTADAAASVLVGLLGAKANISPVKRSLSMQLQQAEAQAAIRAA